MKQTIRYVIFVALLLILATWAMSKVVSAEPPTAIQADDSIVASSPDITKESAQQPSSDARDDQISSELSKNVEQPMSVPESEAMPAMPDRRPLCGPWKNAINHVYCAPGYDVY
ncbi:MAG TPA: hypothetical protein VJQ25_00225 [Nitrospira sp.]|nr:hypothetical protein [Nitrospira sp.]